MSGCAISMCLHKGGNREKQTPTGGRITRASHSIKDTVTPSGDLQLFYPDITWPDISLLADALGEHVAYDMLNSKKAMSSVSYIANEILENAVKYGDTSIAPISIRVSVEGKTLTIEATNKTTRERATILGNEMLVFNGDQEFADMVLDRVKQSYTDNTSHSGIGLSSILLFGGNLDCDISYDLDNHDKATITIKLRIDHDNLL